MLLFAIVEITVFIIYINIDVNMTDEYLSPQVSYSYPISLIYLYLLMMLYFVWQRKAGLIQNTR